MGEEEEERRLRQVACGFFIVSFLLRLTGLDVTLKMTPGECSV